MGTILIQEEEHQVYVLTDIDTFDIYYVGLSNDYIRMFKEHMHNYKIEEILKRGVYLVPLVVYTTKDINIARNYEKRWILHSIQTYQPIVNVETNDSLEVENIRSASINFLDVNTEILDAFITTRCYNLQIERTSQFFRAIF